MEKKTYYVILGVSHGETSGGIRAAYRDRARQIHPDVAGEGATRAFQELNEAYDVLSDPSRRRAYNAQLASESRVVPRALISILDPPETVHPSFAEVRDHEGAGLVRAAHSMSRPMARLRHATPEPGRSARIEADERIELTDRDPCKAP